MRIKNSKRAFSLPVAIITTIVLIMLSSALIIIATTSMSGTSSDKNSRQAYLNVKSALEYATSYYNKVQNVSDMGTQCIIIPEDSKSIAAGGVAGITNVVEVSTATENLTITDDEIEQRVNAAVPNTTTTYVVATYIPPASSGNQGSLKMTAYSSYTDAYGQKPQTARLSVTYTIGTASSELNRITLISVDTGKNLYLHNTQKDTITLNMKQHPDQKWTLAYYVWSFKDRAGVYDGSETCYDVSTTVSGMNSNENTNGGGTIMRPGGVWVGSGSADKLGPPSIATEVGNGWYRNQFSPDDEQVNYFNIILAKKGAVLSNGTHNTQTCEMFHLWYIDPSDKNIYFEFLKPETDYVKGASWNGSDEIEDEVLVYVKNPKTAVHFKIKDVDDTAVIPTISAPVINSVTSGGAPLSGDSYLVPGTTKAVSDLAMTYEGCGWWVANVETNGSFLMTVTYTANGQTRTKTVNVSSTSSSGEAWVVATIGLSPTANNDTIQSRLSEEKANLAIGSSVDDYVTIHVKPEDTSYDLTNTPYPTLSYQVEALKSSEGRRALLDKILEVQALESTDYTTASYSALETVLNEAITLYNDVDYIENRPGPTSAEKIEQADAVYNSKIAAINEKIAALKPEVCDANTISKLSKAVSEGDKVVQAQTASYIYDCDKYTIFVSSGGAYKKAKDLLSTLGADPSQATASYVTTAVTNLNDAIADINSYKLERTQITALIAEAQTYVSGDFPPELLTILQEKITAANTANGNNTRQADIDAAYSELLVALNNVKNSNSTLDKTRYTTLINSAYAMLTADPKENCTDASYNELLEKYTIANTNGVTVTTQEQLDTLCDDLEKAMDEFTIYKPVNTDDKLNSENKIRVWFSGFGDNFDIYAYLKGGDENSRSLLSGLGSDSASGLGYVDIDKNTFDRIEFIVRVTGTTGEEEYKSSVVQIDTVADNNLVVVMNRTNDDGTCDVKQEKLTTLYIEKTTPSGTSNIPLVKMNGTALITPDSGSVYYVARFISATNQKVSINTKSDGTGSQVPEFPVSAGQYVVHYTADNSITQIKADTVYPLYVTTSGSGNGYSISNATYNESEVVSPSILDNASVDAEIVSTSTTKNETMNITLNSNQKIIWVNGDNLSGTGLSGKTPHIYVWNTSSKVLYNGVWPGREMIRYGTSNYFYTVVSKDANMVIFTDGSGNKYSNGTEGHQSISGSIVYWEMTKSGSSFNASSRTVLPTIPVTYDDISTGEMTASNLKMVMVGGEKIRITNKSYVETYGSGKKTNEYGNTIHDSNPFGGNSQGQGRVGDARLETIYDWYEFKIPVDVLNTYAFEIKGLNRAASSVITKQIQNAYGNIWVTLNSTTKTGGRYSDIDIYTFNPDETQMEENVTIYFNNPSGWNPPQISATGVGSSVNQTLTSGGENGYYYITLSKKTPFITFTVNDGTKTRSYRTSLQGGDSILFEPLSNAKNGGWNTFVPAKEKLEREILTAQGVYYGYVLVGKYDYNGYVLDNGSSTYLYPEGLMKCNVWGVDSLRDFIDNGSVKTSKINSMSIGDATSAYNNLHKIITAYKDLYTAMSSARSYIPSVGSGRYPEYINRGNKKVYSASSISNLKTKLSDAESVYTNSSASVSGLNNAEKILRAAISNVSVDSEGSIAAVFVDTKGEVANGSKFEITYSYDNAGARVTDTQEVTDRNPEGYPIIFIEQTAIYDVEFIVNGSATGIKQDVMSEDEAWVYMDTVVSPEWTPNAASDYKQITSETITQQNASDKFTYTLKTRTNTDGTTETVPITLYFENDTTVELTDGSNYMIRAGAYYFKNPNEAPLSSGTIDLYSAEAKTYFTTPENYGKYNEAGVKEGHELSWVTKSDAKLELNTGNKVASVPVNLTANSGSIKTQRSYTTTQQMYFRWEGNKDLIVKNDVTLSASELTIASSGVIDASSVYGKHFYLNCSTAGEDSMKVTFASDVNIKYTDDTGTEHSFVIREGDYEIEKADASQAFIADLFDEKYWTSRIHVKAIGRDGGVLSGTPGKDYLTNPSYS